jgi:hypothetical protein
VADDHAVEAVLMRYADPHRLSSREARQYWRDNHAGEDVGTLLRRIDELEGEVARLRERLRDRAASYYLDFEPPDTCQCGVPGASPPCSWCTSDANPLNVKEARRG